MKEGLRSAFLGGRNGEEALAIGHCHQHSWRGMLVTDMACPHQRVSKTSTHCGLASLPAWLPPFLGLPVPLFPIPMHIKVPLLETGKLLSIMLTAQAWRGDLSSDPLHSHNSWAVSPMHAFVIPELGVWCRGRWMPEALWPVSLAESTSSRFGERPCLE